jgi:hypothetical protein
MANGTAPLQLLRNAMMTVILQRHTGITTHTVSVVNTQAATQSTTIAVGTMKNGPGPIIVQMTNPTKVLGKRLVRVALGVHAAIFGGLQRIAHHTHDFRDGVAIQRFITISQCRQFALLLAAQATSVQASRSGVSQFAAPGIMGTAQNGTGCTVMVGGGQFGRREEGHHRVGHTGCRVQSSATPHQLHRPVLQAQVVPAGRCQETTRPMAATAGRNGGARGP